MPSELHSDVLKRFAKMGAEARLAQIEMERKAILATFPDLALRRPQGGGKQRAPRAAAPVAARRQRRKMTAAQRKEVSERMKKYWAERKKKG